MARLIGLVLTLAGSNCLAATKTWTGASINDPTPANRNNSWTTAANWSGNVIPVPGDDLVFPTASFQAASQNNYAPGTSFGKITIENHTIIGASIVLTNGISATGGLINLNGIKIANQQTFAVSGASSTLLVASPIDLNGQTLNVESSATLLFTNVIGGAGTFNNRGSGLTILTAGNTFATCIAGGTGTLAIAGSQPGITVNVREGGKLGGGGTVGPINVRPSDFGKFPAIAPGIDGPGILNASSGVDYDDDIFSGFSKLLIDINGTDVGTGYDQLKVTGTVDLAENTQLGVTIGAGFTPIPGDVFVIVKNDGTDAITGTFKGPPNLSVPLPEGALLTVGSTNFQISYVGGDGNDITLTVVNGVTAFTATSFSVNEGDGNASITLHRAGGGNTTATVGLALEDITTNPGDYVSPAGKLESSFAPDVNSSIQVMLLQRDGKILVAGLFTVINGQLRSHIARLNADGTLDPSFNGHADRPIETIALQPDGKIIIGGDFRTYSGTPRGGIARLNSDGSLDATFDPGTGVDTLNSESIDAIALQPDGKMIIGGFFSAYNGTSRGFIARLNANGSLDTSYVPAPFNTSVSAIMVDENGKAVVGGVFNKSGTTSVGRITRLNADGSLDASFNAGGTGADNPVIAIARQPDNKIVIGGSFANYNATARKGLARLNADGSLDTSFAPGAATDGFVGEIAVDPAGRLVVGGRFSNYDNVPRRGIVRVLSNGAVDNSFNPGTGTTEAGSNTDSVNALALPRDGTIIAGGRLAKYDGITRHNIARVQGDLTATWAANDFADKTIQLPIVNDTVFEGDEKVRLRIVPLTAGLAAPSTDELTIVDNDPVPSPTPTPTATPTATPAKALNIATRLRVETGDNVMIAGFIITGNANKDVVLRGRGPVLAGFGITDFLADPVLDLRGSGGSILMNNNWKDTQRAQIEGGPFEPSDDRESVILATLAPGAYTGVLTGNNNTTGVGLIEVFDNGSAADSQLANISTRGLVQGNNSVMIGGFILGGSTSNSRIAIRGIGPSLAQFGLNNVLADPTLELHDGNGAILISNDNWESDGTSAGQLSANGLGLSDPTESGIFTSLPAGQFTAILAGKNGGTGIGLIEIYNLQ